ncbi:MAG: CBS domain-containing protein [Rhodocyclaceae bacterium]|nr:CBS domain-containing protein [Rhodocyclaceae bacterium]MCA3076034.1 CBS domain-containing protein [Rhodocyclaceae bacterium]MCA3092163.1 CBS domain-containing protein [Rhodocyclaceae bacterium]MCA3095389.1 CBS domain-containing protein [Rhodocyclaceae bacterium]MCA3096571.1 CBS domain-containing protein [Rhodocyclaceae bacterium]
MNDDSKPGWLTRLGTLLLREPEDRDQLVELLRSASERELLDEEALAMIEGVLEVSELDAGGVMLPRAQIEFIDIGHDPAQIIRQVVAAGHSRFPVIDGGKDEVIGILHAKDLLRFYAEGEGNLRGMLRPAVFVPEAKRLNVLLRDFRRSRNHMAVVVDEYGGVAGLVTIEDVIEQIVGDIEDEYDFDDAEGDIIEVDGVRRIYRVKAATAIEDLNERIGSSFATEDYDTIGGLVVNAFGRVPRRNDRIELGDCEFLVLRADRRRLHLVQVIRTPVVEGQ